MAGMILSAGALFPLLDIAIAGVLASAPFFASFMPLMGGFFAGALAPFLALPGLGSAVLVFATGYLIWQLPGSVGTDAEGLRMKSEATRTKRRWRRRSPQSKVANSARAQLRAASASSVSKCILHAGGNKRLVPARFQ